MGGRDSFLLHIVIAVLVAHAVAFFASRSYARTSTLTMPKAVDADVSPSEGQVLILAFRDGLPAAAVVIRDERGEGMTDKGGVLRRTLPVGSRTLTLPEVTGRVDVPVIGGEETLVSINLISHGVPTIITRAPEAGRAAGSVSLDSGHGTSVELSFHSETDGGPIADVEVRVAGADGEIRSGHEGRARLGLPDGDHVIIARHARHLQEVISVKVAGAGQSHAVAMKPTDSEVEEFVVLTPRSRGSVAALVEVRRQSAAVAEVLGAEQMARQGDSDAGASLRRLAGLTLVGGKYVYVRGLGERYSSVQMNGLSLPSPEPSRRVVPLDLFPTAVLESVIVQKSSAADLPAEFGGGLIQMRTRSLPEKFFARASLSAEVADQGGRLTYRGGETDWLATDDGTREMPQGVKSALLSGRKLNENAPPAFYDGFSADEIQAFGRSLPNIWNVKRTSQGVPPGLTIAVGDGWTSRDWTAGAAASLLTNSGVRKAEREAHRYNVGTLGQLVKDEDATTESSEVERNLGATMDIGGAFRKIQKLSYTQLYVRNASDSVQVKAYTSPSDSVSARELTSLEWVERELHVHQIQGQHRIPGLMDDAPELNWRVGLSQAKRLAPDTREYMYIKRTDTFELNLDTTGNRRLFGELVDRTNEAGADLSLFPKSRHWSGLKLKLGASYLSRERRSDVYRLHFKSRFPSDSGIDLTRSAETLFSPPHIGPDGFVLTNLTESADSYGAASSVEAVFASVEYNPTDHWTVSSGLRRERSKQEVRTFYYYAPDAPTSFAGLRNQDLLPSHSLVWKPNERWRARLAYSETLARPDARELSTVPFIDAESGYETVGNSGLEMTVIRNVDHRWEYYFNTDEYVSAGFFYKRFGKPVEDVFEPSPNLRKTFANALSAENKGLEFETRTGLRRIDRLLRRWTALWNVSLIDSKVRLLPGTLVTNSDRPLQGQSPYVLNFQLQYDRPVWGLSSTLLYNVIGRRISEVGTNQRPDVYEQPLHQVDWVTSLKISKTGTFSLKAKNILDPTARSLQGGQVVRSERKGRSVGFGFAMAI